MRCLVKKTEEFIRVRIYEVGNCYKEKFLDNVNQIERYCKKNGVRSFLYEEEINRHHRTQIRKII